MTGFQRLESLLAEFGATYANKSGNAQNYLIIRGFLAQTGSFDCELDSGMRLLPRRASVHVDFHADRHFDDLWSLPSHFGLPVAGRDFASSSTAKLTWSFRTVPSNFEFGGTSL
jgi:hypothetical protein